MPAPRIVIESFPDDGQAAVRRHFHVNARLTNSDYSEMFGRPLSYSSFREQPSEELQWFINALHAVEGIEEVSIKPYELNVVIGHAFEWTDIEPAIIELIAKHVHWDIAPEIGQIQERYRRRM